LKFGELQNLPTEEKKNNGKEVDRPVGLVMGQNDNKCGGVTGTTFNHEENFSVGFPTRLVNDKKGEARKKKW